MDVNRFLADWSSADAPTKLRLGQARVRSVDSDPIYTISAGQAVIVPSSQEWGRSEIIANYLGEYPPRPGGSCWYATDGVDRIILGMMGPDGPPSASISLTASTATTTAATTVIAMSTLEYDPWNMTDTAGTGLTIPATGMYAISGFATWNQNGTGYRELALRRNGSVLERNRAQTITTAFNPIQSLTLPGYPCNKGDIISMVGVQTSGASLNLTASSLSVQYVGRRRSTSGTATLIPDGSFENNDITSTSSAWQLFWASSATWSLDGSNAQSGVSALKGVHAAGTVSTSVNNYTIIPVVPRQKYRVSAYVKANAAMAATATTGCLLRLLTAPSGNPEYFQSDTTVVASSAIAIGTAYAQVTADLTIPDGAFVARLGLYTASTAANTVYWDNIVVSEIIS